VRAVLVLIVISISSEDVWHLIYHDELLALFIVDIGNGEVSGIAKAAFPLEVVLQLPGESFKQSFDLGS